MRTEARSLQAAVTRAARARGQSPFSSAVPETISHWSFNPCQSVPSVVKVFFVSAARPSVCRASPRSSPPFLLRPCRGQSPSFPDHSTSSSFGKADVRLESLTYEACCRHPGDITGERTIPLVYDGIPLSLCNDSCDLAG